MAMPRVICKTVAMQNNSQWPCSMYPIPQFILVGVRTSYIFYISLDSLSSVPHCKFLFGGGPWLHPVTVMNQYWTM